MVSDANIANPTTVNLSANQAFVLSVTDLTTGCSGIDTVQVTVSSNVLTVNINPSDNNICSGSVVQLTTQVFGGTGSYTYIWSSTPAGFSSAIASPTVNPTESTVYYVTVSDGSSQGTASVNINVLPLPLAAFSYSANQLNVTFTSTSTNVSTFNWNFGDGNNSNVQNPSHTYSQTGDYIVVLIATNSCGSDTVQQTIHVESSGIETNGLSNVNIYPNPVKDILTVAFDKEQPAVISIISFDGRQLLTNDYLSKQCTVDITSLEQGIYVIVIKTGQGILKQMFVKER
jgi:PKD repeat protein